MDVMGGPHRVVLRTVGTAYSLGRGVSTYFKGEDNGFPRLAQTEAILLVHVVLIQLDLNGLPDELVHVSGFGGQDLGVLELDTMSLAMFGYGQFVWMSQTNVPVVLLDPGINGTASVPNVNLTTFAGYAVHAWEFSVPGHPSQAEGN
jgi:hypothetical protein